jgi:hypothetical protein
VPINLAYLPDTLQKGTGGSKLRAMIWSVVPPPLITHLPDPSRKKHPKIFLHVATCVRWAEDEDQVYAVLQSATGLDLAANSTVVSAIFTAFEVKYDAIDSCRGYMQQSKEICHNSHHHLDDHHLYHPDRLVRAQQRNYMSYGAPLYLQNPRSLNSSSHHFSADIIIILLRESGITPSIKAARPRNGRRRRPPRLAPTWAISPCPLPRTTARASTGRSGAYLCN